MIFLLSTVLLMVLPAAAAASPVICSKRRSFCIVSSAVIYHANKPWEIAAFIEVVRRRRLIKGNLKRGWSYCFEKQNQDHAAVTILEGLLPLCPGFSWNRVNFPPSSCCVLDLV